jgi:REP element-mobilizing transposase RayT
MSRGIRKSPIFTDDRDRRRFLSIIGRTIERYRAQCLCYCMMGNHYHLALHTPTDNVDDVMRHINSCYAQYANWRHGWRGHFFEGPFKSLVIGDDVYLRSALAYIARNPVEANLVQDPADWKWSSYAATIGRKASPAFLTTDWLSSLFPGDRLSDSRRSFRLLVESTPEELPDKAVLGSSNAESLARSIIGTTLYRFRVPREYRELGRPPLGVLFGGVKKRDRRTVIRRAHVVHGYRMSDIAAYLDLHPTTVSRIVNQTGSYAS